MSEQTSNNENNNSRGDMDQQAKKYPDPIFFNATRLFKEERFGETVEGVYKEFVDDFVTIKVKGKDKEIPRKTYILENPDNGQRIYVDMKGNLGWKMDKKFSVQPGEYVVIRYNGKSGEFHDFSVEVP